MDASGNICLPSPNVVFCVRKRGHASTGNLTQGRISKMFIKVTCCEDKIEKDVLLLRLCQAALCFIVCLILVYSLAPDWTKAVVMGKMGSQRELNLISFPLHPCYCVSKL